MALVVTKDPNETVTVVFPFADRLGGVAITSVESLTVTVINGTDPGAANVLNGASAISGSDVRQSVRNGVALVDYRLVCRAVLADGRKLVEAITLRVRAK